MCGYLDKGWSRVTYDDSCGGAWQRCLKGMNNPLPGHKLPDGGATFPLYSSAENVCPFRANVTGGVRAGAKRMREELAQTLAPVIKLIAQLKKWGEEGMPEVRAWYGGRACGLCGWLGWYM